jgi:probable rRNA maturation factor
MGESSDCSHVESHAGADEDPEPPSWLRLDIVREGGDWTSCEPCEAAIAAAGSALTAEIAHARAEAAVALASDAHVRVLNRTYRGYDKPTNVLAFPAARSGPRRDEAIFLGDVVLAAETVTREAAEQGKPARQHLQHLVVHGLLHLIGRDHDTEAQEREMEALEIKILERIGVPDPYVDIA